MQMRLPVVLRSVKEGSNYWADIIASVRVVIPGSESQCPFLTCDPLQIELQIGDGNLEKSRF
jgi:hypothetical protein